MAYRLISGDAPGIIAPYRMSTDAAGITLNETNSYRRFDMAQDTAVLTGIGETQRAGEIQIPDLWHLAMWLSNENMQAESDAVLETFHLAHALLRHVRAGC
jgi:hypothetical protein